MVFFSQLVGRVVCAFLLVALIAGMASAAAIQDITFTGQADSVTWTPLSEIDPIAEPNANGLFSESGVTFINAIGNSSPRIDWTISGDVDPVLDGEFNVQNFANVDVTFSLSFDMNSIALAAPTQTSGYIDIELIDVNGDGATFCDNGSDPVYMSLIDGADHESLVAAGSLTLTAAPSGTATYSDSFAVPGGAVVSTLGTELVFKLSAGDRAVIKTNFTVVPEPTSLALLAVGLACLLSLSLRRKK